MSVVKLQIEISLIGEAFADPGPELHRILSGLAAKFEHGVASYNGFLRNAEDLPVGYYRLVGERGQGKT